jgi:acyl carrier protein
VTETAVVRMKRLVAEVVGDESLAGRLADDTDLINDLGLDSIQTISLLLRIEDEFDVEVDFEGLDLDHLRSLRGFTEFLLAPVA